MVSVFKLTSRRGFVRTIKSVGTGVTALFVLARCKVRPGASAALAAEDAAPGEFIALSRTLTGYADGSLDPKLAAAFYSDLRTTFGGAAVDRMLTVFKGLDAASPEFEQQVTDMLMKAHDVGPVAKATIVHWYTGSFNKLETESNVASRAYMRSLVWPTGETKPMGEMGDDVGIWGEPAA